MLQPGAGHSTAGKGASCTRRLDRSAQLRALPVGLGSIRKAPATSRNMANTIHAKTGGGKAGERHGSSLQICNKVEKKKKDAKNKAKPKWLARTRSGSCSSQHFGALGSHHVPPPPPQQAAPSPIPINRLLMTFRSVRISLIIPRIRL